MYEADQTRCQHQAKQDLEDGQATMVNKASQQVLQVLIEFVLSFIQQNKQSILQSIGAYQEDNVDPISAQLKDFTFARFLISCSQEYSDELQRVSGGGMESFAQH